jgi:hypothetical protein
MEHNVCSISSKVEFIAKVGFLMSHHDDSRKNGVDGYAHDNRRNGQDKRYKDACAKRNLVPTYPMFGVT